MAKPNQGPPPGPPPGPPTGTNQGPDLPMRDIDLSNATYISDGQNQQPQATVDNQYLQRLSSIFNRESNWVATLGYTVNFVGGLPQGYILEHRERHLSRNHTNGGVIVDLYIHGHPSGTRFRSMVEFARHVFYIMRNDLANCNCSLCAAQGIA